MSRRKKAQPTALAQVLASVYPSKSPDDLKAIRAFHTCERSVPARLAEAVRPVRLTRGVLQLHAASSVWVQEVSLLETSLIESLRRQQPDCTVRSLRIRVGPLPERPVLPEVKASYPKKRDLTALPEDVARAVATLGDEDLRQVFSQAAAASFGSRSKRSESET